MVKRRATGLKEPGQAADTALAAPPRRSKGRPIGAVAQERRDEIIAAAREILRATAPGKVTRDMVAKRAAVDPKMVTYYFGDTNNLFAAVINSILADNLQRLRKVLKKGGTLQGLIQGRIRLLLQIHTENPYYYQLINDLVLQADRIDTQQLRTEMFLPFYAEMEQVLVDAMAAGEIRPIDPLLIHIAITGLCQHYIAARPVFAEFIGPAESEEAMLDRYAEFAADLVLNGIRDLTKPPRAGEGEKMASRKLRSQ